MCIILEKSLFSAFPLDWLLVVQRHRPYTKQEAQRFESNSGHLDMAVLKKIFDSRKVLASYSTATDMKAVCFHREHVMTSDIF